MKSLLWFEDFTEFRKGTNEGKIISEAIINRIKYKYKEKFLLDIGSGIGDITNSISHYFKEVYATDKRKESKKFLKRRNITFFLDLQKKELDKKFDFILISYVLTGNLVKNQQLLEWAMRHLSDKGELCIVTLAGESLLQKDFKQFSNTTNYFIEQVLRNNGFQFEKQLVRASYKFPKEKLKILNRLFHINVIEKFLLSATVGPKIIEFNLLHNILYAKKDNKKKIFLISGKVGVGKTLISRLVSKEFGAYYFNLDNFLRILAKQNKMTFDDYLNKITRYNKSTIAKLISSELNSLLLTKDKIVLDGVFSPEEILYIGSTTQAKLIPLHIEAKKSFRVKNVLPRHNGNLKLAESYIAFVDRIAKSYGGGEYVPAIFLSQVYNDGEYPSRIVKKIIFELEQVV